MIGLGIGIPFGRRGGIVTSFKSRVAADAGTFEAESCLNTSLNNLRNINLLNSASLLLTPNAYKVSKMYSIIPNTGAGDFTFSRASTAMRRNASGVWESVANNVPRLSYPIGGGCPSWLNEPQSTNVLQHSNNRSLGWTVNANITRTISGTQLNPAGQFSEVLTVNSGGTRDILQTTAKAASSLQYTLTAILKQSVGDWVVLQADDGLNVAGYWFNINSKSIGAVRTNGTGFTLQGFTIDDEEFGFIRISVTITTNTATNLSTRIFIVNGNNSLTANAGQSIFLWNMQTEQRATGTSPIITAGSALTRLADSVVLSNAGALIGQNEGVIFLQFNFTSGVSIGRIGGISNIDLTNRIVLNIVNTDKIQVIGRANNTLFFNISSTIALVSGLNRVAIAYQSGNLALYINGILANTSTDAFTFSALVNRAFPFTNEIDTNASNPLLGSLFYLNQTRLPNAQLAALTTL